MADFLGKVRKSFSNKIEFIKDTRKELNNVSWPGRREVTGTTAVVILAVLFFGGFLFLVDQIINSGMNFLFRAMSAQS
ncbi:MAG: preprotein translocase subunit SecE [Acidobacteria bacterium]|nr:preprotein translocase subunit SecE [Acidobacteriota bacterium]